MGNHTQPLTYRMARHLSLLVGLLCLALSAAFLAPAPAHTSIATHAQSRAARMQPLMACRMNAKKQKAKRNQDNMRKFRKRGTSKRRMVKGSWANQAQEREAEFVAKLFTFSEEEEA
ncbi:unnamed protein product [Chrysoparadoxa australica]